jgi:hypothetical protein
VYTGGITLVLLVDSLYLYVVSFQLKVLYNVAALGVAIVDQKLAELHS